MLYCYYTAVLLPSEGLLLNISMSPAPRATCIAFCPIGDAPLGRQHLVSGHEDGQLRVWDAGSGACLRIHKKKGPEVSAITVLERCDF